MLNKLKKYITGLFLSLYVTEKKVLAPNDVLGEESTGIMMNLLQGRLSNDLMQGEVTQQVKEMRWRMYKVLANTKLKSAKITGYDENGHPIVNVNTKKLTDDLVNLDIDKTLNDTHSVKMYIYNEESAVGYSNLDLDDDKVTFTKGEIDAGKGLIYKLNIVREYFPKFEIEKYTDFLVVRENDEKNVVLEFYIGKYADIYDKKTKFLIKEIEKIKSNPRTVNMLEFNTVSFITNNDKGVPDLLEYMYDVKGFHSISEYKSNYVIRMSADTIINGKNVIEAFIDHDLDEKYANKAAK